MSGESSKYPPFEVSDKLLDELGKELSELKQNDVYEDIPSGRGKDEGETKVLSELIPELDDTIAHNQDENQLLYISAKSYHSSPRVNFEYHKEDESKELADILFLITYLQGGSVDARGSALSQTKFEQSGNNEKWKVSPEQFYLLHELPDFEVVNLKQVAGEFSLSADRKSFTNYSFVGQSYAPFVHTTEGVKENESFNYSHPRKSDYTYNISNLSDPGDRGMGIVAWIKQYASGNYAKQLRDRKEDDMKDLIIQVFSESSFPHTETPDKVPDSDDIQTDGGISSDNQNSDSFAVVHIIVGDDCDPDSFLSRDRDIENQEW